MNVPSTAFGVPAAKFSVLAVGYDDASQIFLVRNSWGDQWGLPECPGYFTIPYAYALHRRLATDFWTLRTVQ